jgi:glycosyltransferase involved in cell wall biosynthesis
MAHKFKIKDVINKNSSIFIATFSQYEKGIRTPRNGMIDQLLYFFLPRVKNLLLLDQPHPVSDSIDPIVETYRDGILRKTFSISSFFYYPVYLFCKMPSKSRTRISYKLRDFFSVIFAAFKVGGEYDLFIGLEAINLLAGLLLKKIGKVKTVVYYVSDYSPTRFGKTLFNSVYLALDRFCVRHADFTWDVSPAMKKGRMEVGLPDQDMGRVLHVPNALFPSQIKSLPISKRIPNSLVYMGALYPEFGPDLAVEALKIIKQEIPDTKLHIIGGGDGLERLKKLVKRLRLEKSVIFYGFVKENDEMAKIVRNSYLGLAPYREGDISSRWYGWYGDAGKIRQYIASGLPVVTTWVPPLGRLIVIQGAGIIAKDTPRSFSKGIMKLLLDRDLYNKLANVAQKISKNNTWENTYLTALRDMEKMV